MSISIPEEKITDSLITAYMKHRRGPKGDLIWQEHFQELADILVRHGIVSPPARWIEITDDPATWPPLNTWVVARHVRGFDLFYAECVVKYLNGQWRTIRDNYASFRDEPTHWRPI